MSVIIYTVADTDEEGGVDVDINWAVDEPGVNVRMGEILNVDQLAVKAPHEAIRDHL